MGDLLVLGSIIEKGHYLIGSTADIPLPRMGQVSAIPSPAAFATLSAASWQHRDGATPRRQAPTRREHYLRRMSAAHTEPSLVAAVTLC